MGLWQFLIPKSKLVAFHSEVHHAAARRRAAAFNRAINNFEVFNFYMVFKMSGLGGVGCGICAAIGKDNT